MKKLHEYNFADRPSIPMTEDVLRALTEFALVLKKIHLRMLAEGYEMVDGTIVKVATSNAYDQEKNKKPITNRTTQTITKR